MIDRLLDVFEMRLLGLETMGERIAKRVCNSVFPGVVAATISVVYAHDCWKLYACMEEREAIEKKFDMEYSFSLSSPYVYRMKRGDLPFEYKYSSDRVSDALQDIKADAFFLFLFSGALYAYSSRKGISKVDNNDTST